MIFVLGSKTKVLSRKKIAHVCHSVCKHSQKEVALSLYFDCNLRIQDQTLIMKPPSVIIGGNFKAKGEQADLKHFGINSYPGKLVAKHRKLFSASVNDATRNP